MTTIVEERVDRFLEHALLIANDDVGRFELEQILQPIVTVDDAAIEIVQIAGGKTSAFQRNQWTQVWRNHGQYFQNHPFRSRVRGDEALHEFQTFRQFLANLFALSISHRLLQLFVELVQVDLS